LRGPINISGTFQNPKVAPDIAQVAGRGAVAAALGVLTGGPGAILPLLDFGGAKDSNCAVLIQEATQTLQQQPQQQQPQRVQSAGSSMRNAK
jgi:hypothetical protein